MSVTSRPGRSRRRWVGIAIAVTVTGVRLLISPVVSIADPPIIVVTEQPENGGASTQVTVTGAQIDTEGHASNDYITITGSDPPNADSFRSGEYSGMTLADLATAAGISPAQVEGATVADANASPGELPEPVTRTQIINGYADPNEADTMPANAVIAGAGVSDTSIAFVPPMAEAGEPNAPDIILTSHGAAPFTQLDVTFMLSGSVLTVRPPGTSPSPPDIDISGSVAFSQPSVLLPNGQPDQNPDLAYSWNFFDGGPGATGPSPVRQYTTAGTWDATVTVTDAAEDASGTAEVPVLVRQTRGDPTGPVGPAGPVGPQTPGAPGGTPSLGADQALTGGGTAPTNALANGAAAPKKKKSASSAPPPNSASDTRTGSPSGTSSRASGGGGSGGTSGGSGDGRGGAAGGRGSGSGVDGGNGKRTTGSTTGGSQSAAQRIAAAARRAGGVNGLVGYVINSTGQAIPISLASSSVTSPRSLTAARASAGSGSSASRLGWIEGGAALLIVVSLGAWLEARPEHGVKAAVPAS